MPHHKAPFRFGTVVVQSICYLRKALCSGLFIARSNRSVTRTKGVPSLLTHKVIEEAYRPGASFVLPKPSFTTKALTERIHDALHSDSAHIKNNDRHLKELLLAGAAVISVR